jgi:hypothetical protein
MPILRKHKAGNFTQVHNSCLEDDDLSWKAKGLLTFLLSRPDDWEFSIKHLSGVGPDGMSSTRTAMHQLMEAGYVDRNRTRGEDGQYGGWVYHVYEQPPTPDSTAVGNPNGGDVGCYNNTDTNNTKTNNTDTDSNESGAAHPPTREDSATVEWESPTELFDDAVPMPTGDGAPPQKQTAPQPPDVPQSPQELREWIADTDTGGMGWRVGKVFQALFCPWVSDDQLRKEYLGRLIREANRMVGEVNHDGDPMDKSRSRIELAVALLHLYQERDDLHGREDPGARKDQPTAVLNVIADQITRKVKDDEQQPENDFRPDDPLHQLVRQAERSHA